MFIYCLEDTTLVGSSYYMMGGLGNCCRRGNTVAGFGSALVTLPHTALDPAPSEWAGAKQSC